MNPSPALPSSTVTLAFWWAGLCAGPRDRLDPSRDPANDLPIHANAGKRPRTKIGQDNDRKVGGEQIARMQYNPGFRCSSKIGSSSQSFLWVRDWVSDNKSRCSRGLDPSVSRPSKAALLHREAAHQWPSHSNAFNISPVHRSSLLGPDKDNGTKG
ncbi:hypothetical protein LZ30DRAFT_122271 [Colletotrichum cereale]|nr:hypothetical protein LZ30DRAFT_122271 [Colletotrichum cereale]